MTDWPDVERDGDECVKDDDIGEERQDADDGGATGGLGRLTTARDAARYEHLPRQNLLELGAVRVLP